MEGDERSLVEQASRGDLDALEELLRRHHGPLVAFVARRGAGLPADKESAADIVQSVCRDVLEHLRDERLEYRGAPEFRAWLYEAALLKIRERRRHWAAERRDPGREREVDADRLPAVSATPSRHAAGREENEGARRLLARLPERYRVVIELARIEGLSHREIGARLGVSESGSRMLLNRALARLSTLAEREGLA